MIIKFRDRLNQEAAELRAADAETEDDRAPVELDQVSVGRLSRMDALQQQAMAQAQSRRRAGRLKAIAAALKRMEEDEFGWCQSCGEAIAIGRLELDPTASQCISCATG
ncbi:MAG: TraR/DksA C4-type zinc finger protein [Pseudomonadota bacterium]